MIPFDLLQRPGEHPFSFEGAAGIMEGVLTVPDTLAGPWVALLGHPHSLQGGTMNNKVVTTLARAFRECGVPALRFNFRGVGQSQGVYDAGIGESEDMLALRALWAQRFPDARFLFAGFSFGSYVCYRAAAQGASHVLISVAPPVHHYDYQQWSPQPSPWYLLQGEDDEVVPAELVYEFAARANPAIPVLRYPECSHFFHGKLLPLKDDVMRIVRERIAAL